MLRKSSLFLIYCLILQNVKYMEALFGHNVEPLPEHEFDASVCIMQHSVQNPETFVMKCSGTIMTQTHIVTAEHCLDDAADNAIKILLGNGSISEGRRADVLWFITYDTWAIRQKINITTQHNNIAVLKMVSLAEKLEPALFSFVSPHELLNGLRTKIHGCGRTMVGNIPNRIQVGNVDVFKLTDCMNRLSELEGKLVPLPLNYMCTRANPYVHADVIDAGGPLTFFGSLVALTINLCPPMNNTFDVEKINVHLIIDYYRGFLRDTFRY